MIQEMTVRKKWVEMKTSSKYQKFSPEEISDSPKVFPEIFLPSIDKPDN